MTSWYRAVALLLGSGLWALAAQAGELVLIIDDIGYNYERDTRALMLPGPVTLSILPFTPYGAELASFARAEDKPVMLHLPMQPDGLESKSPGNLVRGMAQAQFVASLRRSLDAIPHLIGVNNHQGSALTQDAEPMQWLMAELQQRQLFFVDSRTSAATVAAQMAERAGVPNSSRDLFLDHQQTPAFIHQQFQKAVALAQQRGRVVLIGHPYPETLDYLEAHLPELAAQGVRLVSPQQVVTAPRALAGRATP